MEWEDLGYQKATSTKFMGKEIPVGVEMYRTPVPGGWLILIISSSSSVSFYPDPEHKWDPHGKYEASYLLRAAEVEE